MARYANRIKYISLLLAIIGLWSLARQLPTDQIAQLVLNRIETAGLWAPVYFMLIYVTATILLVPGAALTLVAGAMFGLVEGLIVVSVASTTTAAIAFLIGRYLARGSVQRWAKRHPRFLAVEKALTKDGWWKTIALLRLSPVVPYNVINYFFGLTSIGFRSYIVTSWWAMLPGTFMYVYLGYVGRIGLIAAGNGSTGYDSLRWTMMLVGLLATIAVTVYIARLVRPVLQEQNSMADLLEPRDQDPANEPQGNFWAAAASVGLAVVILTAAACAYLQQDVILGIFGPPQVTPEEKYANHPNGPKFDHSVLDVVLKTHVDRHGLVDYKALAKNPVELDRYIQLVSHAPFDELGRDEKLALLINAYNAFTLRLILDYYPLKSIKDIPAAKRWDAQRWRVGKNTWSLNQIEHEQVRPNFKEPRIHFALVCAAIGCPPLRNEVYTADRLEEQLEDQSRYVHTHKRWFLYNPDQNTVGLTSLYNWYGGDFEQAAGSVLNFAARYSPSLKRSIDADSHPTIQWLDYDWTLNGQENAP